MPRRSPTAQRRPASRVHSSEPLEPRLLLAALTPHLVKDINAISGPSDPYSFVTFKGATWFRADDGTGTKWFRTDGTPGGTSKVDLFAGSGGPNDTPRDNTAVAVLGDSLLFAAFTPATDVELFKTDGTAAGTVLVKDIRPGDWPSTPQRFVVVGDTLYFVADDGTNGLQLWKTDGTGAGTQPLTSIATTNTLTPYPLAGVNGKLLFAAQAPEEGGPPNSELWVTDGTPQGTTLLKNININGPASPGMIGNLESAVVVVNGTVYFGATDLHLGRELFRSDGTAAGTVMVADLNPDLPSSDPYNLTDVNGTLYFTGTAPGGIGTNVYRVDPVTGVVSTIGTFDGSAHAAGNVGGVFYVAGLSNGQVSLFKYDPTAPLAGLTLVKALHPASFWSGGGAGNILDVNGKAVFLAPDNFASAAERRIELWQSNGTADGTTPLATYQDLPSGSNDTEAYARWHLTGGAGGLAYFAGKDPIAGTEPVRTDGTSAGTFFLGDLNSPTLNSDPSLTGFLGNNRWVFTATDPDHGRELWVTDGTDAGTSLVKDILPGTAGAFPNLPPLFSPAQNGRLFFAANSVANTTPDVLWSTDGTPAGTYRLNSVAPGTTPRSFNVLGARTYFIATGRDRGLWVTDGTDAGTQRIYPLDRTTYGPLLRSGDALYFTTYRQDVGNELWTTDGTAAGTRAVSYYSQEPIGTGTSPVTMGGVQYFLSPGATYQNALWRLDAAGNPVMVTELDGPFTHLVATPTRLVLSRGRAGIQTTPDVWVSDGTAAGTVRLSSLVPALATFTADSRFLGDVQLTAANGVAYFFGAAGTGTPSVWRTDGTAAGTKALHAFPSGATLQDLGVADGVLYFSGGTELWRTDGTDAGTVQVKNEPAGAVDPGDIVFYANSDPVHGNELWAKKGGTEVYVRGLWQSSFVTYLGTHNVGDANIGYRVDDRDGDVLPWANVRQILVRLPEGWSGGAPTAAMLKIQSQRAAPGYFATSVIPFGGLPRVYSFALNRALGDNGERLTLTLAGAGKGGADLVVPLNVLVGDVDGSGTVLANDFSAVKKRFFKDVRSPTNPGDPSVDYNPLYDIDGSGSILAADYSAVKARFFQALPPPPPAVASATVAIARSRPVTRELFSSRAMLA